MVSNPNLTPPGGVGLPMPITAPGPSSEFLVTVPAGVQWEVVALAFLFSASAVVGNRAVRIQFDNGNTPAFAATAYDQLLAASSVTRMLFSRGFSKPWIDAGLTAYGPLAAGLVLYPGYRIYSVTANMQVGDQYNGIMLTVK